MLKDNDKYKLVGLYSPKLTASEQRYSTFEAKLLSVSQSIKHFK
jgi:RNase H-like domain found in reverse transcriptase